MARRLVIAAIILVLPSLVSAQTETTDNLLPNISEFEAQGGTVTGPARGCPSGAFCTSGTSGGGGFYRTDFDVPLTQEEVNAGFDLTYGADVTSHSSNAVLGTCTDILQSGDCRDIFRLAVSLSDAGNVVEKFEHEVELDFTGLRNFTFDSSVGANNYGLLTGQYEFFGIDAGFPSAFFGPQISDPQLTITYNPVDTILQEQIVLDVLDDIDPIQTVDADPVDAPITVVESPAEPEAPTEADVSDDLASDEVASDPELEQSEEADADMEPEGDQEQTDIEEPETEVADEQEESETDTAEAEESTEDTQEPKKQQKAQASKKSRIKYNAAIQTRAIIAMASMTARLEDSVKLNDTSGFFTEDKLPDSVIPIDYRSQYSWIGASNGAHDALVNLQWGR
tara:strand:+ start:492 stop:1679 length:1188 start_codon:yes stop_codon:yes gene_type:complete